MKKSTIFAIILTVTIVVLGIIALSWYLTRHTPVLLQAP